MFPSNSTSRTDVLVKYILLYSFLVALGGTLLAFAIIFIEDSLGYTPPVITGFITNIVMCFVSATIVLKHFKDNYHRVFSKNEYFKIILFSALIVNIFSFVAFEVFAPAPPENFPQHIYIEFLAAAFIFSLITQVFLIWISFYLNMRFFTMKTTVKKEYVPKPSWDNKITKKAPARKKAVPAAMVVETTKPAKAKKKPAVKAKPKKKAAPASKKKSKKVTKVIKDGSEA